MLDTIWDFQSVNDQLDEQLFEKFLEDNFSSKKISMIKTFQNNDIKNISSYSNFKKHLKLCPIRQVNLNVSDHPTSIPPYKHPTSTNTQQHVLLNFIAGACAGVVSRTLTAPIDRLRYLVATSDDINSSVVSLFKNIYKTEGVVGYWRGNLVNCIKIAPEAGVKFLTQELLLKQMNNKDDGKIEIYERLASGAVSGAVSQFLIQPLDLAKIRLALSHRKIQRSLGHLLGKVYEQEGVRGYYRGLLPSLQGVMIYTSLELSLYSQTKDMFNLGSNRSVNPNPMLYSLLGGMSCFLASLAAHPFNVVRSRIIKQQIPGNEKQQRGFYDCFVKTQRDQGIRGLQKGFATSSFKSVPGVAISFTVQEQVLKNLKLTDLQ